MDDINKFLDSKSQKPGLLHTTPDSGIELSASKYCKKALGKGGKALDTS